MASVGQRPPLVTLLENHCYAEPEWAEALIEAISNSWAAVGPVVANANPQTINSNVKAISEWPPVCFDTH